jgi:NAD-dependent deacetylase
MSNSSNIVILTGAGISAESGVKTFRDNGGLWEEHRIEDVATPEAFMHDPDLVQNFYNIRRAQMETVKPNAAHSALAKLEAEHSGTVTIITQNVDDLHERAGSQIVIHMHGELAKVRCRICNKVHRWHGDCDQSTACPDCGASPSLRPHIVWFGEMPFYMPEIGKILRQADIFVSIGTSGNVYPAAGFVAEVAAIGRAKTIELNLEPSQGSVYFDETRHGPAGKTVPQFVGELLSQGMT